MKPFLFGLLTIFLLAGCAGQQPPAEPSQNEPVHAKETPSEAEEATGEGTGAMTQVGLPLPEGEVTPVDEVLSDSDAFLHQEVILVGKVARQCPMAQEGHGCWLSLLGMKSESGKELYVEFENAPAGFYPKAFPEGTEVRVFGVVARKGSEPTAQSGPIKEGEVYLQARGAAFKEG